MNSGLTMDGEEDEEADDDDDVEYLGKQEWNKLKVRANALRHLVSRDPLAADIKLTLFASAVFSHRYAEVAYPVPTEYVGNDGIHLLTEALDAAPAMRLLLTGGPAAMLAPQRSLDLVEWLLTPPTQPGAPGGTLRALSRPAPTPDAPTPNYLFQVENPRLDERWRNIARGKKTHVAFLGQSLDVYHSLVHRGLLTGGEETTLRRTLKEAIEDSIPGYGLGSSELGSRLRCVAECEVAETHNVDITTPSGDILLRDGKNARISRLFIFQVPWDTLNDTLSSKTSRLQAINGSTISTSPFKLPEFRFEVETTNQYSTSDKCKEKESSIINQDEKKVTSSSLPTCYIGRSANNKFPVAATTSKDNVNKNNIKYPSKEKTHKKSSLKEQETEKQVTQSDVSSVIDSPKLSECSNDDSLSTGPLYSKIQLLDPIIPSRTNCVDQFQLEDCEDSTDSMDSKDATENKNKTPFALSNVMSNGSDTMPSDEKYTSSTDGRTDSKHETTLQMLQQIMDRLNGTDNDFYNQSAGPQETNVVQENNKSLENETYLFDYSFSGESYEKEKGTMENSTNMSQELYSKDIWSMATEETEIGDTNRTLPTGDSLNASSLKVLTNPYYSSLSSKKFNDTVQGKAEEKISYTVQTDRVSTTSSAATWAESESPSEIKFWDVVKEEKNELLDDEDLEKYTVSSQESEDLRRDFEKHVLEPIRSKKGNERGGKRLIILLLQSSPSSDKL